MQRFNKVYETYYCYKKYSPHYHSVFVNVPFFVIKGKYLNQFGFTAGTRLSVELSQNQIIITPIND